VKLGTLTGTGRLIVSGGGGIRGRSSRPRSKPVAITVTFIASSMLGSMTMPEMMLASGSTESAMMRAASATSCRVRS
jgi:hypothetical protein